MNENRYQNKVLEKLRELFPGCIILKNDSSYLQGIQDFTLLWQKHWAVLEIKKSRTAARQPNQEYYVEQLGRMSFAAFIYPENEEEVFDALQQAFGSSR